ncbi:helix-turn-helix transcriptional regulator, partial [Bacillus mycoides]
MSRSLGKLAQCLRAARAYRGLTYAQLADRTGYHSTTLQRAASGKRIPTLPVALAYAHACGLSSSDVRHLWREARREERRAGRRARSGPAPQLDLVRDLADLSAALVALYESIGAPTVRALERRAELRAKDFGSLSRASAHRVISRQTVPRTQKQWEAFLTACEVPAPELPAWVRAWSRARRHHQAELDKARRPPLAELEARLVDGKPGSRIAPEKAGTMLRDSGLVALEPYRGFGNAWASRCLTCSLVGCVRLSDLAGGQGSCAAWRA